MIDFGDTVEVGQGAVSRSSDSLTKDRGLNGSVLVEACLVRASGIDQRVLVTTINGRYVDKANEQWILRMEIVPRLKQCFLLMIDEVAILARWGTRYRLQDVSGE